MDYKRIEIALNVLFWVLMTWLFVFGENTMDVLSIEAVDGGKYKETVRNYDRLYAFIISQCVLIIFFYVELYLIHQLNRPKAVWIFVLKSVLLATIALLVCFVLVKTVAFPNNDSVKDLSAIVPMIVFYTAVAICYGFTKNWMKHEKEKAQLELTKNQVELNLLRQQLQPHFLFNTMNNLLAMVNQTDNPKLAESIDKLSGLLRYVVYDTQRKKISIAEEIEFVKNFVALHLLRFEEGEVDLTFGITGTYDTQKIEPGIFLCYVENAFKHGVQPEIKSFINIQLDISMPDRVYFSIENSIPEHPFQYEKGGFGIKSNQERLALVYPNRHTISFVINETYLVELNIKTDESNHSGR